MSKNINQVSSASGEPASAKFSRKVWFIVCSIFSISLYIYLTEYFGTHILAYRGILTPIVLLLDFKVSFWFLIAIAGAYLFSSADKHNFLEISFPLMRHSGGLALMTAAVVPGVGFSLEVLTLKIFSGVIVYVMSVLAVGRMAKYAIERGK